MALIDNLVAGYAFETTGNLVDVLGSNDLTETGGTIPRVTGSVGFARDFEITDGFYFKHADNATFSMGAEQAVTISVRVKFESLVDGETICGKWNNSGDIEYMLFYSAANDRITFLVSSNGSSGFAQVYHPDTGSPTTGVWYNVVAWHDPVNNQLGIWINQSPPYPAVVSQSAGIFDGTADFTVGSRHGGDNPFDGLIDELYIWKRVLSYQEMYFLNLSGVTHPFSSPVYSSQSGDWNTAGTWMGNAVPASSDAPTIFPSHVVTVTSDTSHGTGDDATAILTCLGQLVVTGCKFIQRGKATYGNVGAGIFGAAVTRLLIQPNGSTPGQYILDCDSGKTPVVTIGDVTRVKVAGTSSARCSIRTKAIAAGDGSDSAGNNGYFIQAGAGGFIRLDLNYYSLYGVGDLDNDAFGSVSCGPDSCIMTNGIIEAGGKIYMTADTGTSVLRFNYNKCLSTLTTSEITGAWQIGGAALTFMTDGGVREIIGNVVRKGNFKLQNRNVTGHHNIFLEGLTSVDLGEYNNNDPTPLECDVWEYNFVRIVQTGFGEGASWGTNTNEFILADCEMFNTRCFLSNEVMSYCVIQPLRDTNKNMWFATEGSTVPRELSQHHNIVLKNREFPTRQMMLGQGFHGGTGGANTAAYSGEHNTIYCAPGENGGGVITAYSLPLGGMAEIPHDGHADEIVSVKSNIFWRDGTGPGSGCMAVSIYGGLVTSHPVVDEMRASAASHNCHLNLDRLASGTWSGTTGDTDISAGTVYNGPMSGSTPPGANDLADTDPQFVDPTRCLETWSQFMGSTASTDADLRADAYEYLADDPATNIAALLAYVREGFRPQNELLRAAGHDGEDIGAIALGGSVSFSISPSTIPANHAGEIKLVAVGIGTTWLDDNEVFAGSGVDSVVVIRQVIHSNTLADIFVRTI